MKKTILFALIVVGLAGSFFVGISVSQEQKAGISRVPRVHSQAQSSALTDEVVTQETQPQRLRNELLQMFQQRLQTMNEKELNAKKADLQKELGEDEANAKLQKAVKLLNEILKTYPKSRAAEQARRMLPAHLQIEELEDAGDESAETAIEAAISRQIEEGN